MKQDRKVVKKIPIVNSERPIILKESCDETIEEFVEYLKIHIETDCISETIEESIDKYTQKYLLRKRNAVINNRTIIKCDLCSKQGLFPVGETELLCVKHKKKDDECKFN